jgi:hypothetical protein
MEKIMKGIIYAAVGCVCGVFDSSAMNDNNFIEIRVNPTKIEERLLSTFIRLEKQLEGRDVAKITQVSIARASSYSWITKNDSAVVFAALVRYANEHSAKFPRSKALFDRTEDRAGGRGDLTPTIWVSTITHDLKEVTVDGRSYTVRLEKDR